MKKVLVSGCNGQMGQIVCRLIAKDPELQVVCGIDANYTARTGYDFPVLASVDEYDKYTMETYNADVIIDFSSPSGTMDLIAVALNKKCPVVIATTGHSKSTIKFMESVRDIPIFYSANMSYDICLFKKLIKYIVPQLAPDTDIEIIEEHHNRKADSPSGTALFLANAINESLGGSKKIVYGRTGKRSVDEIGISSIRGGNICGTHTVKFFSENDTFEIKHISHSRDIFAEGAIAAAKFIMEDNRKPGLYTMDDMF